MLVTAANRSDRHHLGVRYHRPRQVAVQMSLDLVVEFQVALTTGIAHEARALPHQHHGPSRHRQIAHPPLANVIYSPTGEPAMRTS
jgi:hypothetical protein